MKEDFNDNPPFKNELEELPEGRSTLLKQFKNDTNLIIRKHVSLDNWNESCDVDENKFANGFEYAKEIGRHHKEINDRFGIKIAPFEYIVGEDEKGEKFVYSIVNRIYGNRLKDAFEQKILDPDKDIEKINNLVNSIIDYYEEKLSEGKFFLDDLTNVSNYFYGHKKEEKEESIYLVDLGPELYSIEQQDKNPNIPNSCNRIEYWLSSMVSELEEITGVRLMNCRERVVEFRRKFGINTKGRTRSF